jgi:hypothetical protein
MVVPGSWALFFVIEVLPACAVRFFGFSSSGVARDFGVTLQPGGIFHNSEETMSHGSTKEM